MSNNQNSFPGLIALGIFLGSIFFGYYMGSSHWQKYAKDYEGKLNDVSVAIEEMERTLTSYECLDENVVYDVRDDLYEAVRGYR